MLELLATVDPMATLMGGLWLFAAGMFPVGFMLGSECSPCCNSNRCGLCTEGELPETLTVTFDGLQDKTPGPDLITIGFSSCFGGGASARVTAPGGDPETDKGPISAISLTSGGSGYAKLGRVAPTVTASGGSGSGVTLTPTLTQAQDSCEVDYWKVTAVSVSGGTGYADGDQVTFSVAEGDTEATAASATIHTTRNEPALTASASGGTGATFSISYTKNDGPPPTWSIDSISVTNGGSGYSGGSTLNISLGTDDVEVYGTYAYITTDRTQPTLSASVNGTGSGASLTVSLSSGYGDEYGPTWTVSSIGITNGGSGYSEWDQVAVTVTDGQQSYWGYFDAYVTGVDENGAITAITIYYGGDYYKDLGVITGASLYYGGGEYYKDDGIPTSVSVEGGGVYYREDASASPYVAEVTVAVGGQTAPSVGTGASFTATVDSTPGSSTFGMITSISVANGGSNYLAWEWRNTKCCGDYYNGMSVVVKRANYGSGDACTYTHRMCGVGNIRNSPGRVTVSYNGHSSPPTVVLVSEIPPDGGNASSICNTSFSTTNLITNCSDWTVDGGGPLVLTATGGATASVSAGGEYDATFRNAGGASCYICCKGEELVTEVTATVTDSRGAGFDYSGDYVLSGPGAGGWETKLQLDAQHAILVRIRIDPCSSQTAAEFGPWKYFPTNDPGYECDFCHKKCWTWAAIYTAGQATQLEVYGASSWWFDDRQCVDENGMFVQDQCGLCFDTPACSPSGKTYSLCPPGGPNFVQQCGSNCGQFTIGVQ